MRIDQRQSWDSLRPLTWHRPSSSTWVCEQVPSLPVHHQQFQGRGRVGTPRCWPRGPLGTLPVEGLQKMTALRRQELSQDIRRLTRGMHSPGSPQDPWLPLLMLFCRSLCSLPAPPAVSRPPTSHPPPPALRSFPGKAAPTLDVGFLGGASGKEPACQ